MSIMSFMMRVMCKKNDAKRDAGLSYPDNVVRVENISYGPHKMNVLDVYRPKSEEEKLPVIVSVHGGGPGLLPVKQERPYRGMHQDLCCTGDHCRQHCRDRCTKRHLFCGVPAAIHRGGKRQEPCT